jgi:hypothetical protein
VSLFGRLNSGLFPVKRAVSRTLKTRFPRLDYAVWAWRNPGKTFKDYYAESITAALEGKKQHASLGPVLKTGRDETARRTFKLLLAKGISPGFESYCAHQGCGAGFAGRHYSARSQPSDWKRWARTGAYDG